MRNIIITAVAAFALGGITTGVLLAQAQPAGPPPDGPRGGQMARGPWGTGPGGPGAWGDKMREHHARRMELRRDFSLMFRPDDRKLTPPDVKKIAEAFLLWRGNHAWKVVEVAPTADGGIGFALATQDGSVIARFTMDPHSARVTRTG
jgi:hypothetical protein